MNKLTKKTFKAAKRRIQKELPPLNGADILVRSTTIPKLAYGGKRDVSIHLDSIDVRNRLILFDRRVILLDDVITTGNSMEACRQLLLTSKPKSVECWALAKAIHT